jgi:DNA-binding NarL/FixJ family response regulator
MDSGPGRWETELVKPPIRIALADDHSLVRRTIRECLELDGDIVVVGEAKDGREAVEMVVPTDPDVVLLDYRMPRLNGLEAARIIHHHRPALGMVILTGDDDIAVRAEAVRSGVRGFVLKSAPVERLLDTIRRVFRGDTVIDLVAVEGAEAGAGPA